MVKVTKESLEKRIKGIDATEHCVGLSLQAEYNREVYRMLLAYMKDDDVCDCLTTYCNCGKSE